MRKHLSESVVRRHRRILRLLAKGRKTSQVARLVGVSPRTVRWVRQVHQQAWAETREAS